MITNGNMREYPTQPVNSFRDETVSLDMTFKLLYGQLKTMRKVLYGGVVLYAFLYVNPKAEVFTKSASEARRTNL